MTEPTPLTGLTAELASGGRNRKPWPLRVKIIAGITLGVLLAGGTFGALAIANTLTHQSALETARKSVRILGQTEITLNARTKDAEARLTEAGALAAAVAAAASGTAGILPAAELEHLAATGTALTVRLDEFAESGEIAEGEDGTAVLTAVALGAPNRFVTAETNTAVLQETSAAIDRYTKELQPAIQAAEGLGAEVTVMTDAVDTALIAVAAVAPEAAAVANAAHRPRQLTCTRRPAWPVPISPHSTLPHRPISTRSRLQPGP